MMTTVTIPAICDMDVSNLTEDQLEVMRLLIAAAEKGFHDRSEFHKHVEGPRRQAKELADSCSILLDRLRAEHMKRPKLQQLGEDDENT
jgi:hypothetical protein